MNTRMLPVIYVSYVHRSDLDWNAKHDEAAWSRDIEGHTAGTIGFRGHQLGLEEIHINVMLLEFYVEMHHAFATLLLGMPKKFVSLPMSAEGFNVSSHEGRVSIENKGKEILVCGRSDFAHSINELRRSIKKEMTNVYPMISSSQEFSFLFG